MTPQEIDSFDRSGFAILRQAVPAALVADLRAAAEARLAQGAASDLDFCWVESAAGPVASSINNLHRHLRPLSLALAAVPALRAAGRTLCGDGYITVSERLLAKDGGEASDIRWHQDMVHDRASRIVTVGVYLTPSRAEDGGVHFVAGSQHAPQDMARFAAAPPDSVSADLEPGDVLLHDVMTVHASRPLRRQSRRLTVYFEFRALAHVEANPRFPPAWLAQRRALDAAAMQAYRRWETFEGGDATEAATAALIAAAYAQRAQIEAARY